MITSDTSRSNLSSKVKLNILLTNVVSSNPAQARCIRYNIRDGPFNLQGGVMVFF